MMKTPGGLHTGCRSLDGVAKSAPFFVGVGGDLGGRRAKVAELVDALDLGSSGVTRESSSLSFRTIIGIVGLCR